MADRANRNRLSRSGFTLIELAIVLVIVGLLVGIGSGMVGVLTSAIKVRETRDSLDANMQAIASWASANNKLPDATVTGFVAVAKSPQDSWGRDFLYFYDVSLNTAPITKDTICGRRSTNLTVHTTDPVATINNVAFVVLSEADDAAVQTTLTATTTPVVAATFNGVPSGPSIAKGSRGSATGTINIDPNNSDLVRWVTLDELRSKVGCQGAPLKIVNNELPFGNFSTQYAAGGAVVTPDGGTGGYQWRVKSKLMPRGISFTPSMSTSVINGYSQFTNLSTSAWSTISNNLTIGGLPRPSGSYSLTIQVKDGSDNIASKPFVMTINPN